MQKIYGAIQAEGAELIAISSDTQAQVKRTTERIKADFPVLSDAERKTISAYNATDAFNRNIARPQYHIIDENGIVQWKFVDVRLAGRLDPAKILEALKAL